MVTTVAHPRGGVTFGGSSTVSFAHGSAQADSAIKVLWDFDNDGDFDETAEDVTAYLVAAESVAGRDWPSQLTGKAGPGQLRLQLRNDDDRFSYFNAASPLNQAPFSLRTGRKIRVQTTSASTTADPGLLARDRFNGSGPLGVDELGNAWSETAARFVRSGGRAVTTVDDGSSLHRALIDVAQTDYYVQTTLGHRDSDNNAGLLFRFIDATNAAYVQLSFEFFSVRYQVLGVETELFNINGFEQYANMTFGVGVVGNTVTLYVEGVAMGSGTLPSALSTGDQVGIFGFWGEERPVSFNDFYAWDSVPAEVEGILWTGDVESVFPAVELGPDKVADVAGEGWLAKMAISQVTPSPSPVAGRATGIAVGHLASLAGLSHPPPARSEGDVTTGPHGFDRGSALELARHFEDVERGFIYETNEGHVGYQSRSARDATRTVAEFSDAPGAQFGYSKITPFDWRREIINEVVAGVAPVAPTVQGDLLVGQSSTGSGVDNDVAVALPTTTAGDLLVVLISSTVQSAGREWIIPAGWKSLRDAKDAIRQRVYVRRCDGTESGATVTFYNDNAAGGAWIAYTYRIQNWYGSLDGVAMADHVTSVASLGGTPQQGSNPAPLSPPWGLEPTLFIVTRSGLTSASGGSVETYVPPAGYTQNASTFVNGSVNGFDVVQQTSRRYTVTHVENPGEFGSDISGFEFVESTVVAVRGSRGVPPPDTGRVVVRGEDLDSQDAHGGTPRTYATSADLFATIDDAQVFIGAVLALYSEDRPIFEITFPATLNSAYRAQAIRRRVGHKIRLRADGETGLGVDGDFFIENVRHAWSAAGKFWTVTWQLSPA